MDCCQTIVSASRTGTTLVLQVVEEPKNERRVQISDGQARRRFLQTALSKADQETECVSVSGDGIWTRAALVHQTFGKIRLQESREGGVGFHKWRRVCARSKRNVANLRSSGAAERCR